LISRKCTINDALHGVAIGKALYMEEAAARKRPASSFSLFEVMMMIGRLSALIVSLSRKT